MEPQNPDYKQRVREILDEAPYLGWLGVRLDDLGPGWCRTSMEITEKVHQQDGFVHAGVQASLADHSGGMAAGSLIRADDRVLSIEFKINLLRPARGEVLHCHSKILRPGKRIMVAESEVFCRREGEEKLVSKGVITLAVVPGE